VTRPAANPPAPLRLAGATVCLREFRSDDLEDSLAVVGDERVTRWLSFDTKNREQAREMLSGAIERAKAHPRIEYYLAIASQDDRLIGFARLGLGGVQAAKLGYAIAADFWGKGYGTDAVRTMLSFAFNELRLHRVTAAIGPDNKASITLVERLGFTREGHLRDHVFTNGSWRDSILYSVLTTEWQCYPSTIPTPGTP
jgi:ribosomal-protein-alanine N-acetyltransferase